MSNKRAIARLRKLCLALPQVEERPFGGHTAPCWRVRDKLFVTTAADETWMTCKARPGVQQALVGSDSNRFFVPRYTGKSGWIGIRLDAKPDWGEIAELIEESYRMTAPKSSSPSSSRRRAAPLADGPLTSSAVVLDAIQDNVRRRRIGGWTSIPPRSNH